MTRQEKPDLLPKSDTPSETPKKKLPPVQTLLLILLLLSLPCACCGWIYMLDTLPARLLPPAMDFTLNLFESYARVQNNSGVILYVTPLTTTTGTPLVIPQPSSIRQRDFPLGPCASVNLTYDSADSPLSGLAICKSENDCRLLAVDYSNQYLINSFEELPPLESSWQAAVQSYPEYNLIIVLFWMAGLLPIFLLFGWRHSVRLEKQKAG